MIEIFIKFFIMDFELIRNKIKKNILEWSSKDMDKFFEIIGLTRVFELEKINLFGLSINKFNLLF